MPERNAARTIRVAIGRTAGAIGLLLYGYAAAGLIGGAIPTNRAWHAPTRGITIWAASNGIHTDLILPKVAAGNGWRIDWRPLLRPEHLRDPRYAGYGYAGFGWGDAKFYRETPAWSDVRPATVLAAAVGSTATLAHVIHLPRPLPASDVRPIVLSPEQYRRLAAYIRATIAPAPAHQFGYGGYDVFYTARGRYGALRTCNAWTGDALRHAGVRIGAWTPFPATVLWWF